MDVQISHFRATMQVLSEIEETLGLLQSALETKQENISCLKETARRTVERVDVLINKLDKTAD